MSQHALGLAELIEQTPYRIGVAARHLESGETLAINAEQSFCLASTYKIPMAVTALQQVARGELELHSPIAIEHDDYVSPGLISEWLDIPGTQLPLQTLLTLMLSHSDNTATDVVLRVIGGVAPVRQSLTDLGISGLSIDRNTADLIIDYFDSPGMRQRLVQGENVQQAWANTLAEPAEARAWDEALARRQHDPEYLAAAAADPRDKGTPMAMLELLQAIADGRALDEPYRELLWAMMRRCVTGDARIRAGLPEDCVVANKTGSLFPVAGAINDAGLISLPEGRGNIALVVYTDINDADYAPQERSIAAVAAQVYAHFMKS